MIMTYANDSAHCPTIKAQFLATKIIFSNTWHPIHKWKLTQITLPPNGHSLKQVGFFFFFLGAVAFISYASIGSIIDESFVSAENLMTKEKLHNFYLNSKVVSGTMGSRKNTSLSVPVNFTFQHEKVCDNRIL